MPTHSASSGKDFRLARRQNMSLTMDGQLRLASRNLLPDPGFREFEPDGSLRHWTLSAPRVSTARNVYIGTDGERLTSQSATPIQRGTDRYIQSLALTVGGAGLPSVKPADGYLERGRPPALYRQPGEARGYPAGLYPVSYAWVVGSLYLPRYRALTNPAPPLYVPLAEGQSYELPLPEERAEGALGIAILQGEPDGPADLLYVQEIIDIRAFMPPSRVMDGPLRTGWRAPRTNETYCGAFGSLPGPRLKKTYGVRTLYPMRVRASFKFRTDQGVSASQGYTDRVVLKEQKKSALRFFFPRLPARAIAVIPQIQSPDSQWQDLDYGLRGGDVPIIPGWDWHPYFFTDDAEKSRELVTYNGSERSLVDETGIPGPDAALEEARSFGRARLGPGRQTVRVTDLYTADDGRTIESPPSEPRSITTQSGEDLVVDFREEVEEGNVLPNADFEDRKPDGDPRGYRFPAQPSANLSVSAARSVVRFDDSTGRTNNETIFESEMFSVGQAQTYCFRGGVRFSRATSGTAQLALYFYDGGGQQVGAQSVFNTAAADTQELTCGPAGTGCDYTWPDTTRYMAYECRLIGNVSARNLAGRFVHLGLFRGMSAPRKVGDGLGSIPEIEPEEEPYPGGSYMAVIENPSWAEGKGNGLEYYGSSPAPVRPRYFASGMRVPLEPNRLYVLHGSYSYKGARSGSRILPLVVKDDADQVVENLSELARVPDAAAGEHTLKSGSGTFAKVIETGPDASYMEFLPSDLGPGLVRAWGMQLEYGSVATAWTDEVYAGTGYTGKNLLTANQSSVEDGTANDWRPVNCNISASTETVYEGTYSLGAECVSDGNYYPDTLNEMATCPAGQDLTVQAYVDAPDGKETGLYIVRRDPATNGVLSTEYTRTITGEGWQFVSVYSQAIETDSLIQVQSYTFDGVSGDITYLDRLQLEYGDTATEWEIGTQGGTDFSAAGAKGSVAATFRTRTPGLDPYPALARRLYGIKRLLDSGATADTPEGTEVSLRLRSRRAEDDEWSEYVEDVADLQHTEIIEAEATATTSDLSVSPEISEVFVRSEPPRSVLLRADGSEYPGGVLVENLPATGYGEATEETPRTDNTRRLRELYEPAPELTGFTVKALTDEGANAVMWDSSHGERLFVIEGQGLRRVVRMVGVKLGVNRREKFGEGLYAHTAEDVSAEIIEEEPLEAIAETEVLA